MEAKNHITDTYPLFQGEISQSNDSSNQKYEFFSNSAGIMKLDYSNINYRSSIYSYQKSGFNTNNIPQYYPSQRFLNLKIGKSIQTEMLRNIEFRRFIFFIEILLNKSHIIQYYNLNLNLNFKKDWESNSDNKIVLTLDFENLSFNREMELWKELSSNIHQNLRHSNYLNYVNNFFIQLKLD